MFTGIIETTAKVLSIADGKLSIERPKSFDDIKLGSSIAILGTCLSVIVFDDSSMTFDVVPTTFSKTKLGSLKTGDKVNLERALAANGRFEGHIVLGHIEGVAAVESLSDQILSIKLPKNLLPFVVHHGSIAIDGVSLTVADLQGDKVSVALIPLTLEETTLGDLKKGDSVNIETDVLGKYVVKH